MSEPKLEKLAKELETVEQGKKEKSEDVSIFPELLTHVRNDYYPRVDLIEELKVAKLKYFADKLASGYYDQEEENNE